MNRIALIYEKLCRYWLSELGLGNRSRMGYLVHWITLGPLRNSSRGILARWFRFHEPSWVHENDSKSFAIRTQVPWLKWINPAYWIYWCSNFLYEWIVSRPYISLGPAIPGVLIAIAMCFVVYLLSFSKNEWRNDFYRSVLTQSTSANDDQLARLALANLADRAPEQADLQIRRALLEEKMGNKNEALRAMAILATAKESRCGLLRWRSIHIH